MLQICDQDNLPITYGEVMSVKNKSIALIDRNTITLYIGNKLPIESYVPSDKEDKIFFKKALKDNNYKVFEFHTEPTQEEIDWADYCQQMEDERDLKMLKEAEYEIEETRQFNEMLQEEYDKMWKEDLY